MDRVGRWTALIRPPETRFFGFIALWGLGAGLVYWIVSGEIAGTVLLGGLGLACLIVALRLVRLRSASLARPAEGAPLGQDGAAAATEDPAGATEDRPFVDEGGLIPDASIGPFGVGLGAALMATGLIFGIAPLVVGIVPFVWGATAWLQSARDELWTTEDLDDVLEPDAEPSTGPLAPGA